MIDEPRYLTELSEYVEHHLDDPTALIAAMASLLTDPMSYNSNKGQPNSPLSRFAEELLLRDRPLQAHLRDETTPVSRTLIDGKWCAVWRQSRTASPPNPSPEYDLCISFAGPDRAIAQRIAEILTADTELKREIFYDEFEKTTLWGEELFTDLHDVYSRRSKFCLILFSDAYRQRAWTRHELRAAQKRVLDERQAYVLPVELEEGAVPDDFLTIGHWKFNPGDESRIAEAIEEKIGEYIEKHYYSLDLLTEMLNRDMVSNGILDGFKTAIGQKLDTDDEIGAQALIVIALIISADMANVKKSVRAVTNLILFSPGPVADIFDKDDRFYVTDSASVLRTLHTNGPFFLSKQGWAELIEPYRINWDEYDDGGGEDES